MRKTFFNFSLFGFFFLVAACGSKPTDGNKTSDAISIFKGQPGDSAIYGLACDGCTDSILVFLPYSGGDPDTFDIINARQQQRIFGRPHVGDDLSVLVNSENPEEALCIINLSTLEGMWCYMAEPTLRISNGRIPTLPDSIRKKILEPTEYSIQLKSDNSAITRGNMRRNDMRPSLAVYPDIHRYTEWYPYNGRIILRADTIAGFSKEGEKPVTDTAEIMLLRRDSLILRIGDKQQAFYRKVKSKK